LLQRRKRAKKEATMNAYEIAEIEKGVKANYRLPVSYDVWAGLEQEARQARARAVGQMLSHFVGAVVQKTAAAVRQVRSIAAQCTGARLRHDH
jgi:hypothetical protein